MNRPVKRRLKLFAIATRLQKVADELHDLGETDAAERLETLVRYLHAQAAR